jgi:hypothetical protein
MDIDKTCRKDAKSAKKGNKEFSEKTLRPLRLCGGC